MCGAVCVCGNQPSLTTSAVGQGVLGPRQLSTVTAPLTHESPSPYVSTETPFSEPWNNMTQKPRAVPRSRAWMESEIQGQTWISPSL